MKSAEESPMKPDNSPARRKIVPVEPTPDMNAAGYSSMLANGKRETHLHWSAMLSASPDTTEEDVERVARALVISLGMDPDDTDGMTGNKRWQTELPQARAAIAAMLEG